MEFAVMLALFYICLCLTLDYDLKRKEKRDDRK